MHIILDKSESIFLWESYTQHFIKSIKFSTIFTHIRIFELDSSQEEPSICTINSDYSINLNSAIFREEKSITLVFSDITGNSWKSNRMFEVLDRWSKGSFVTIVSMLPKRMWKKTPLRQGISLFMKPRKFLPKNRDLKAEFDFMGTKNSDKSVNIPMLTFDSYAFSHLSNVLMSKKGSWIDTRTFKNIVIKEVVKSNKKYISPQERVKNFFSFALPKTRELAVYCSVLPLNQEIIREVIKARDLGNEKDVFAEFYFGGLIDKDAEVTFGEYAFYKGVAKELRQYISVQEMKILLHQVSEVMSSSFGVNTKKLNLLYESANNGEELNDNERALVALIIEVLEDKGRFYAGEVRRLRENVGSIEKGEFFEVEKSNLILLYKEDTLDINLLAIADHLNKICNYLIFEVGEEPFELEDKTISVPLSYIQLEKEYVLSTKNALRAIFFTEKAYDNNYFFEPRTNEKDDNLRIVSFNGWDSLTTLSKNNGAVYFIAMLVALISRKPVQHDKKTGCVYDFLGIKNDIDNNMRDANICTECLNILLEKDSFSDGGILDDLNSILNFIGKVSRNNLDIFAKEDELKESIILKLKKSGWDESNILQEYKIPDSRYRADLLLNYKNKDLAVIEIKSPRNEPKAGLKQAITYGKQLDIGYIYSTNGLEIYKYSLKNEIGKYIDEYPSPNELYDRYDSSDKQSKEDRLRNIPYLKDNLRRHHKEAIITIIEGIINQNKRILLSLVSGTGKHAVMLEVLHKLYNLSWYENRILNILFLSDRYNNLRYWERTFQDLNNKPINLTYKMIDRVNTQYKNDFFDFIIIDEVPRPRDRVDRTNKWQKILDYYSESSFISFTTLYDEKMRDYFGGISYQYSLEDAIVDGNIRPYKVIPHNIASLEVPLYQQLGKAGISSLIATMLEYIDSKHKIGQTIIICNNIEDVNQVGISLKDTGVNQYITFTSENRQDKLREVYAFQRGSDTRRNNIRILIMTKHMRDIEFPYIDNIVLMTPITSKYQLVGLLSTRVEKRNLFTQKYLKIVDFFFDEHKDYYNLELTKRDNIKVDDFEGFRKKQAEKAEAERLRIEKLEEEEKQKKRERDASRDWYLIYDSNNIDTLKEFMDKHSETVYAKKAKEKILEIESYFTSLPPVERKLEELYRDEKNMPKSTLLLKKIQDGEFDFEKCEALKLLKEMLIFENNWKEVSRAKNTQKDKWYQRTLEVMELLKNCGSENKINIVEAISKNLKDTLMDAHKQAKREEKKKKNFDKLKRSKKKR